MQTDAMQADMFVEIPAGSRDKHEMGHERGRIRLDRTLFTAIARPADYGYIPDLPPRTEAHRRNGLLGAPTFPAAPSGYAPSACSGCTTSTARRPSCCARPPPTRAGGTSTRSPTCRST